MAADKSIFSKEALKKAWRRIYRSKSKRKRNTSRGIDGITIQQFKDNEAEYIDTLWKDLQTDSFRFQKLYAYQQKKPGKKKPRLIQAPTVRDRVVLSVINNYLGQRQPADSFRDLGIVGSVKGTTPRRIVREVLSYESEGFIAVFKTDIKDYFPSVDIPRLKRMMNSLLKEEVYLRKLIFDFLNINKERGLAQGSAISPLLANIYLRAFDKKLANRKDIKHLRYVDDIIVFAKEKRKAKEVYKPIKVQLWGRGLSIHSLSSRSKTQTGMLRSGVIDVLGVRFTKQGLKIKQSKVDGFRKEVIGKLKPAVILKDGDKSVPQNLREYIEKLNHRIRGWGSAYALCDEEELYTQLDTEIHGRLNALLDSLSTPRGKGRPRLFLDSSKRKKLLFSVAKLESIRIKVRSSARWMRK